MASIAAALATATSESAAAAAAVAAGAVAGGPPGTREGDSPRMRGLTGDAALRGGRCYK